MGQEDRDEITFSADDLGIDPPLSDQVVRSAEHGSRYQREHRLPEGAYLGEDLETALVMFADRHGPTD